jgi:hypothetical protein
MSSLRGGLSFVGNDLVIALTAFIFTHFPCKQVLKIINI